MTFPRDDRSEPDGGPGPADAEPLSQTYASQPAERQTEAAALTEADLFAPTSEPLPGFDRPPLRPRNPWAPPDADSLTEPPDGDGVADDGRPPAGRPLFDLDAMSQEGLVLGVPAAAATRDGSGRRVRRVAWELVQTLALAVLIFFVVRAVVQNFRVEGPSMEPGLHNGQYLLVNKAVYFKLDLGTLSKYIPFIKAEPGEERFLFHGPQRGDVIVFRYPRDPDRDFIKRVIGVPGDRVRIESGVVYVNDVPLKEDYIVDSGGRDLPEEVVPARNYFVLGDNRPNSSDSRNWGYVPEENIIGKAMLSYWPLSELGGVGNTRLDLGVVKIPLPLPW